MFNSPVRTALIVGLIVGFLLGARVGMWWVVRKMIVADIRARARSIKRKAGRR